MQRQIATTKFHAALSVLPLMLIALLSASCGSSPNATANQAPPAADQSSAPRQLYWVTATRVKPDMMAQFREFYQKESLPAMQKGGVTQQSVWTSSLGDSFECVTIRPIDALKQLDEPWGLPKALGEEGYRKWNAKRGQMIISSRTFVMQSRPELSIAPNSSYTPKLAIVVRQSMMPGHRLDYENYVKNDILPIVKKTNPRGFLVNKVTVGGDTEEYIGVTLVDSFADSERWVAALQKEGYLNVLLKQAGFMAHREQVMYRYVPELSIRPEPPKAGDK